MKSFFVVVNNLFPVYGIQWNTACPTVDYILTFYVFQCLIEFITYDLMSGTEA